MDINKEERCKMAIKTQPQYKRKKKSSSKKKKFIYFFGGGKADGNSSMKELLGGKGANLAEMTNLGIPVPPGFTISTEMCKVFYENGERYRDVINGELMDNLSKVEKIMGARFGDPNNPLLVSVRSGARISMPGMMDTILNLGLNDETVDGLVQQTKNARSAYDSYRRFIQMYGDVVLGVKKEIFEEAIQSLKDKKEVRVDTELNEQDLREIVQIFKSIVKEHTQKDFPDEPMEQLWGAISAVFLSWNNKRAQTYRRLNRIPDDWGTAVNVQSMVFGNMGQDSATGVAFTRDPATGENVFYGEYLVNAQGEDVVAGIRTPQPLNRIQKERNKIDLPSLEEEMPQIYSQLLDIRSRLERHYRDIQDIEFTIQKGRLWMLQTRVGKRTAPAAIRIAVEMVNEGLITPKEAVMRISPEQLSQLLHKMFDPKAERKYLTKGLPASPGAASGQVYFTADDASELSKKGQRVILVRHETSPEDIHGMIGAQGILTARGGMTSHAAVVARGMGKCCVAGCEAIDIDYEKEEFKVGNVVVRKGDYISLDGTTGEVMLGEVPTMDSEITQVIKGKLNAKDSYLYQLYEQLMCWVDEIKLLGVRANADTPQDAILARSFGAEGIGLCRTEHMFFAEDRIPKVRAMIMASFSEERRKAIDELLSLQKEDFKGLLKAMDGLPVVIRLLDPPLHEFLPKYEELLVRLAELRLKGGSKDKIQELERLLERVEYLREFNPMLGHRGCRLGITFPEINMMQTRAIIEAAIELKKEGYKPHPEIMIPLVGHVNELKEAKRQIQLVAEEVIRDSGVEVECIVGTMIELPRAAITADLIATEAKFFSFGTNDLTQTTFGFSRDDVEGKFLPIYIDKKILENNPFAVLDRDGVGELIKIGIEKGRKANRELEVGICGEHGGEPSSIEFCHQLGMNYVSCSPYRVPIARLAAAQAQIKHSRDKI